MIHRKAEDESHSIVLVNFEFVELRPKQSVWRSTQFKSRKILFLFNVDFK